MASTRLSLTRAFGLLARVWLALLLQPLLAGPLGAGRASFACFSLATGCVLAAAPGLRLCGGNAALAAIACAATFLVAGSAALGWARASGGGVPAASDAWTLAASLLLAPLFEELLYREHLFAALRPRAGAWRTIAFTSLLFALPHFEPLALSAAFATGVALGVTRLVTGSAAICVGIHAGWNLAWVAAASAG